MNLLKRHPIILSIVFFFFAIQLLSFNLDNRKRFDPLSRFVFNLAYYPQKVTSFFTRGTLRLWRGYVDLIGVKKENEELNEEIRKLRLERFELVETEIQNKRLKRLLGLKKLSPYPTASAQVIAVAPSHLGSQIIVIDKGTEDGVLEGMPTATYEGIVGRVIFSGDKASEVLLITDEMSAIDAYVQRTRSRGIVKGRGSRCVMEYIEKGADLELGDKIVSSGKDGVFPKGVVIGTVTDIRVEGGFIIAVITPEVDLINLEEVVVFLKLPELEITAAQ